MKEMMKKVCSRFEEYLCMILMVIMCFATTLQIICRLLGHPLVWSMELSVYCFIWVAFIGMAWAEKNHSHFAVDVFTRWIKGRPKMVLDMVNDVLAAGFYAFLVYWAAMYFPTLVKQLSTALRISKSVPEAAMIVGFGLCLIHRISHLIRTGVSFKNGETAEEGVK